MTPEDIDAAAQDVQESVGEPGPVFVAGARVGDRDGAGDRALRARLAIGLLEQVGMDIRVVEAGRPAVGVQGRPAHARLLIVSARWRATSSPDWSLRSC
jgi:hypothetical protein